MDAIMQGKKYQLGIDGNLLSAYKKALAKSLERLRNTIYSVKKRKNMEPSEKLIWLTDLEAELMALEQMYKLFDAL